MKKAIIFGASDTGKRIYEDIKDEVDVIFFVDEDNRKWNQIIVDNKIAKTPQSILCDEYDYLYIGVLTHYKEVMDQLSKMNIDRGKILTKYVEIPTEARIECLRNIRNIIDEEEISGQCAEVGVYQGDFAKEINRIFNDRKLYLFDTFEGFADCDCKSEMFRGFADSNKKGYFSNTTENMVLEKMKYKENVKICRGYFPDSAVGINEDWCFVNLDADLYEPTLAGLHYFYPRMQPGGIILIHDYFSKAFYGVREAVKYYCRKNKISYIPIGDTLSVAIRKSI
jgi:O-methyltransferase